MIIESVGKWTRGMSSDLGYATRSFSQFCSVALVCGGGRA
jgi:hypothetical protein